MRKHLRRAYCSKCGHRQTFERYGIRHGLHFVLSILTGGLWLISWFALIVGEGFRPWHCEQCGKQRLGLKSLPPVGSESERLVANASPIESRSSGGWGLLLAILLTAAIGYVDYITGPEISFTAVYLIPVYLAAWFGGLSAGVMISLLVSLVMFSSEIQWSDFFSNSFAPCINALLRLSIFISASILISAARKFYRDSQNLAEIKENPPAPKPARQSAEKTSPK